MPERLNARVLRLPLVTEPERRLNTGDPMEHRILFVDDDAHILDAYRRQLRKQFQVDTALGGHDALAEVERQNDPDYYAVVVADMRMPRMDGVEFLSRLRVSAPNTVRIML